MLVVLVHALVPLVWQALSTNQHRLPINACRIVELDFTKTLRTKHVQRVLAAAYTVKEGQPQTAPLVPLVVAQQTFICYTTALLTNGVA